MTMHWSSNDVEEKSDIANKKGFIHSYLSHVLWLYIKLETNQNACAIHRYTANIL